MILTQSSWNFRMGLYNERSDARKHWGGVKLGEPLKGPPTMDTTLAL